MDYAVFGVAFLPLALFFLFIIILVFFFLFKFLLTNTVLVSKLLSQAHGTQIALGRANLFCKGDLFNHLIFFRGRLFIRFPRLRRTLRGYSNKA